MHFGGSLDFLYCTNPRCYVGNRNCRGEIKTQIHGNRKKVEIVEFKKPDKEIMFILMCLKIFQPIKNQSRGRNLT